MTRRRIAKRVRAQASLICAMAASNTIGIHDAMRWLSGVVLLDAPGSDAVTDLATAAFSAARAATETPDGWQRWTLQMAEAEALLRTGWSP